jgi:hypothetical protein
MSELSFEVWIWAGWICRLGFAHSQAHTGHVQLFPELDGLGLGLVRSLLEAGVRLLEVPLRLLALPKFRLV